MQNLRICCFIKKISIFIAEPKLRMEVFFVKRAYMSSLSSAMRQTKETKF